LPKQEPAAFGGNFGGSFKSDFGDFGKPQTQANTGGPSGWMKFDDTGMGMN